MQVITVSAAFYLSLSNRKLNMNFPDTYTADFKYPSEAHKYLELTQHYLTGLTLDLGSGGWPVVPHAIQVELPKDQFDAYTGGRIPAYPIQIHGDIFNLPFKNDAVDSIHSSHLIEDFPRDQWLVLFREWGRVLKPGGHMVVLVPEHERWQYCVQVLGQTPNCSHFGREPSVGDMTHYATQVGFEVITERLTDLFPNDYTIMGIFKKP